MSEAELLASLPALERDRLLSTLTDEELFLLNYDWEFWGRPKQLPPPGDWLTWVIRAGRGFGKTRTGTEWVHRRAMEFPGRWIAFVAKTPADARDYMIEGPGGLLKNCPPWELPHYEPSKRRVTWPNKSWATIYSDEEPEGLRGFSGDTAWLDEFAKYRNPQETWENLEFGMREASTDFPRKLITTTPKPVKILRDIQKDSSTVVVVGSSYENKSNLSPVWFEKTISKYEGTTFGRQEIYAEDIEEASGALWNRKMISDAFREDYPDLVRIVVAVDPAGGEGEDHDDVGMVVGGIDEYGYGYLLEDISAGMSAAKTSKAAVDAYHLWQADRIVAEINNGGDWIENGIRNIRPSALNAGGANVAYKTLHASRGKRTRAEPIAALYEQKRIRHIGRFPELEDELCTWEPDSKMDSPNRLDALVWLFTELMLDTGSIVEIPVAI